MILLAANDLRLEVQGRELFNGLGCRVEAGSNIEIHGSNGSGKSTLLRVLLGLQRPDHGTVTRHVGRIGYVGHRLGLTGLMTLGENLRWLGALAGHNSAESEVRGALERMGIGGCFNREVRHLSAGQAKRGALAGLTLSGSKLWVLDEPLSSLDAQGVSLLSEVLTSHRDEGGSAIIATHASIMDSSAETIELQN